MRRHFEEVLFGRDDFSQPPILHHQRVAMLQRHRMGEIHQHLILMREPQHSAPHMPLLMVKHGDIKSRAGPSSGAQE